MSMVPLGGLMSSAAGVPLSQSKGSETERAQKDSLAQNRQVDANQKAELASGIGQTEQDEESSERDADGRRLWESPTKPGNESSGEDPVVEITTRQSKDATGQAGTKLDLTG
jgi:hypothetical protein